MMAQRLVSVGFGHKDLGGAYVVRFALLVEKVGDRPFGLSSGPWKP